MLVLWFVCHEQAYVSLFNFGKIKNLNKDGKVEKTRGEKYLDENAVKNKTK